MFAPVVEELIYRGLTLKIFQKAFPFWAANVMQAALFGLMHMNLIQKFLRIHFWVSLLGLASGRPHLEH
ncbi:MAG: lysostaphin resistance A-like protein [Lachnospiraceae bacterium]